MIYGGAFDPAAIKKKITSLELKTEEAGFWDDLPAASAVMNKIKQLKSKITPWQTLIKEVEDTLTMASLAQEEEDIDAESEAGSMLKQVKNSYKKARLFFLLGGEVDAESAYLTLHSGSGGTEAEDWTSMLYRMYIRYIERNNFTYEVLDTEEGEGGLKSITIEVKGPYAYGLLKGEGGVHRLVRISPFDANKRRHTSFASVYVLPILNEEIEVEIKPEDLRIDTYRAGGKGGQHLNKTDSAVRFTHLPTGIVVSCQSERSQIFNRQVCLSMLKSRLYEYYRQKKEEEEAKFHPDKKEITWGSQVRSYVFCPYTLVKDYRSGYETANIAAVMDGDLEEIINSFLLSTLQSKGKKEDKVEEGQEDKSKQVSKGK